MMDLRASLSPARWGVPLLSAALLSPLAPQAARSEEFSWVTQGPVIFAPSRAADKKLLDSERSGHGKPSANAAAVRGPSELPATVARHAPVAATPIERLPPVLPTPISIERLPKVAADKAVAKASEKPATPATEKQPQPPAADAVVEPKQPSVQAGPTPEKPAVVSSSVPAIVPPTVPTAKVVEPVERQPSPPAIEAKPSVEQPKAPAISPAMASVSRQAEVHIQRGMALADRRAYYSARLEFLQALKLMAGALDAEQGTDRHGLALSAGLKALDESDEFIPKESALAADMNVAAIAAVHRTPVVRTAPQGVSPTVALQKYYTYAQEQLGQSVEKSAVGSTALAGLGKLHSVMGGDRTAHAVAAEPKALALHQAALLADGQNSMAANELGVLLARYGRYEDARVWLEHSVALAPTPSTWHNLAVVHEQLGQPHLAEQARRQHLARQPGRPKANNNAPDVRWVTVQEFTGQVKPTQMPTAAPAQTKQAATGESRETIVRLPAEDKPRRE